MLLLPLRRWPGTIDAGRFQRIGTVACLMRSPGGAVPNRKSPTVLFGDPENRSGSGRLAGVMPERGPFLGRHLRVVLRALLAPVVPQLKTGAAAIGRAVHGSTDHDPVVVLV